MYNLTPIRVPGLRPSVLAGLINETINYSKCQLRDIVRVAFTIAARIVNDVTQRSLVSLLRMSPNRRQDELTMQAWVCTLVATCCAQADRLGPRGYHPRTLEKLLMLVNYLPSHQLHHQCTKSFECSLIIIDRRGSIIFFFRFY